MQVKPAKTMILRNRGAGFFSNFNCVLNNLRHRLGADGIEAAVVEWRADRDHEEFPYGTAADGNLWLRFFEPLPFDRFPRQTVDYATYATPHITWRSAYTTHKADRRWRANYHDLFRRYIRVRPEIERRVSAFAHERMTGRYCVGVHYRHPAHAVETPYPVPPLEAFAARASALLPRDGPRAVFLATDVEEAVHLFRERFGNLLVVQPDLRRAQTARDEQLHHDNSCPDPELGVEVLSDCLLLSRCEVMVYTNSNLATAAAYINPGLGLAYCEPAWQAAVAKLRVLKWRMQERPDRI